MTIVTRLDIQENPVVVGAAGNKIQSSLPGVLPVGVVDQNDTVL